MNRGAPVKSRERPCFTFHLPSHFVVTASDRPRPRSSSSVLRLYAWRGPLGGPPSAERRPTTSSARGTCRPGRSCSPSSPPRPPRSPSSRSRHRRPRRSHLSPAGSRLPRWPDRRGDLAAPRLLPRRPGDRLRPARDRASASATRRLISAVFLVTRFLGDARSGVRERHPARAGDRLEHSDLDRGDGLVTMVYTWFGGFKAVVWTDVLQLGGVPGGRHRRVVRRLVAGRRAAAALSAAAPAGKLKVIDPADRLHHDLHPAWRSGRRRAPLGRLARHRPPHRAAAAGDPLAPGRPASRWWDRDHGDLPVLRSSCSWARPSGPPAWLPDTCPATSSFPRSCVTTFRTGLAGLVVAGILAAAMGTHSSAINSLASSATHDLYASLDRPRDPAHLLRVGRICSRASGRSP